MKNEESKGLSVLSECLDKKDPVIELASQACRKFYSAGEDLRQLGFAAQTVFLANRFDGEMLNGGIHQFFCNSSGGYAPETLRALETLGASISASILQKGIETLAIDEEAIKSEILRYESIENNGLLPRLQELDKEYYANVHSFPNEPDEPENIWKLCESFMRKHSSDLIDAP